MPSDLPNYTDFIGPAAESFQYETLDYRGRLEILDAEGRVARFRRKQRIRFLENGVTTFFDRVWGDGVLFANYFAERMHLLEAIPTRKGYVIVLALPRTFSKGETFDVITERKIVGGLPGERNYWESAMQVPTQLLTVDIFAPPGGRFGNPEIVGPAKGDVGARIRSRTFHFRVRSPALHTPYRLTWLKK